ncbi:ubiquinol-cytochrome c reductase iron-sulfur subunit [Salsipaludibacter albus]|uniref:ubiquinol-cytochrome c reductase iron-sulfur subunit n=1 Tax=Salsipaludibacter albus TaxID=2849650 RepID=UPI001EE42E2E|nr:Rieske 2Fe-2S domain-containing protein [Salsipaludibacter albus]MBY5163519.1 Rieske 2Fe-2S domain-containing protein [Salsipaludibacter albus]
MADQTTTDERDDKARAEDRATRIAALCFGVSILAALGLLVVYLTGGDTQLEGILLTLAFGGVAAGLGVWVRVLIGPSVIVEPRDPMPSRAEDRAGFEQDFDSTVDEVKVGGRRRFLLQLLGGAGASLGLALTVPLLSLGPIFDPNARRELFDTSWSAGRRLVTIEGEELRPEMLAVDEIATVFPADSDRAADSQAVLVHTRPGAIDLSTLPYPDGVVDGLVVYSKICTHAGCPVGLYRAQDAELICPCHQSQFLVTAGAKVLSGPTGRPLPQLPIGVDDEGFLVATGEFSAPVGPSFWNLTQGQDS